MRAPDDLVNMSVVMGKIQGVDFLRNSPAFLKHALYLTFFVNTRTKQNEFK